MRRIIPTCVLCSLLFIISCKKEDARNASTCYLQQVTDSASAGDYQSFEYNTDHQLIKYLSALGGGSPNNGYVDTFIYVNKLLVNSYYSLGHIIKPTPYAKTDYELAGSLPKKSAYYYLGTNLITSSEFTFDNAGRISIIRQTSHNNTMGGRAHITRFEYDMQDNLSKIYLQEGGYPEYVCKEYLDYDDKANPFYGLAWYFDFDVYLYNDHQLPRHNYGRIKTYSSFAGSAPQLSSDITIHRSYNSDDKLVKRSFYNTQGNSYIRAELFSYNCQ